MGPAEWGNGACGLSEDEPPARCVGAIPHLLREHQARARETLQRTDHLGGGQAHREEVPRAFAGEHGPRAAFASPVPRRSVVVLAIAVADIAAPRGAGGQAGFEVRVHALQPAEDALVLWSAQ